MRFYRVTYSANSGENHGYSWHGSKREAEKAARDFARDHGDGCDGRVDSVQITADKAGILAALNEHATHNDNG